MTEETSTVDQSLCGRTLVLHRPHNSKEAARALVFIHGGAWIDQKNTSRDFEKLCATMVDSSKGVLNYSLFSIDYRLSPGVKHPIHLRDIVKNLYQLIQEFHIDSLQLVGHSVGATMAWQVAVSAESLFTSRDEIAAVRARLVGLYLVDGIYSLSELLDEYPDYDYFVSQAFEDGARSFEEFKYSIKRLPLDVPAIHLLHSYKDELLTLRQANYMASLLQENAIPFTAYFSDMGLHEEVYTNAKLANYLLNNVSFT